MNLGAYFIACGDESVVCGEISVAAIELPIPKTGSGGVGALEAK